MHIYSHAFNQYAIRRVYVWVRILELISYMNDILQLNIFQLTKLQRIVSLSLIEEEKSYIISISKHVNHKNFDNFSNLLHCNWMINFLWQQKIETTNVEIRSHRSFASQNWANVSILRFTFFFFIICLCVKQRSLFWFLMQTKWHDFSCLYDEIRCCNEMCVFERVITSELDSKSKINQILI